MIVRIGCAHHAGKLDPPDVIMVRDHDGEALGAVCPCGAAELITVHGAEWRGPRRRRFLSLPVSLPDAREDRIVDEKAAARQRRSIRAMGLGSRYVPPVRPRDQLSRPAPTVNHDAQYCTVGALLADTALSKRHLSKEEVRRMRDDLENKRFGGR